ncbi:hypothetical protein QBC33DRAFT_511431 [Phialemonium atrogriseum]|uniref:Protein kinase domain-containing protein n=1 Tax=Phialemonium atrogriseum TaxID=1093897 RepID=A0AAJ0C868_9PEZI|nr:uncharacterized protein QBC33DRAFT_511431 [Phialemonium atrogriseum]KAK1771950.1 hypothetical protein QBC33DRAFT_511431 [Phialemonium atrogriseum]
MTASQGSVGPNYANFGIAIPQLQDFDEEAIADHFANPVVIPVIPRDPSSPRDSIPTYITECVSLGSFLADNHCFPPSEEFRLKTLDFGRDKEITELPGAAPPMVRPPEVYIYSLSDGKVGSIWSKEADIWAIGCITGGELLSPEGDSEYQLYQALQLGGSPPKEWLEVWDLEKLCERTRGWSQPVLLSFDTDQAWESRRPQRDPKSEVFLDLIRAMVKTEPGRRSQIAHLLGHAFFLGEPSTKTGP